MSDDSLIIDLIPPMELHLLLGVLNNLLKSLKDSWPNTDKWLAVLHIQIKRYHGGQLAGHENS